MQIIKNVSEPPVFPPPVLPNDEKSKEAVLKNGGWWAEYYLGDFREHIIGNQLHAQVPNGELSKSWGDKDGEGPPELGGTIGDFSVRLHAKRFLQEGRFVFKVLADDRSRVRVDGKEIISAWKVGSFHQNGSILLQQGWHDIEVDYMNDNFNAYINLNWKKIP